MTKKLTTLFLAALFIIIALAPFVLMSQPAYAAGEDGTRDTITPTLAVYSGTIESLSAASGDGNRFYNNFQTWIVISNSYTATITATIVGRTAPTDSVDIAVDASERIIAGPFNIRRFSQVSAGNKNYVFIDWDDAVTDTVADSVFVGAFKLR